MGLGNFFTKRSAAAGTTEPTVVASPASQLPTQANLEELQDAWTELAHAAKGSGVTSFHACTRSDKPCQEDPDPVRLLAATILKIRRQEKGADPQRSQSEFIITQPGQH
jgi:hypothetical protein